MYLETGMNTRVTPAALTLLDEVRDLVAERIHLDHQASGMRSTSRSIDEAIEDRLPLPVARKVIVGQGRAGNAFRPVLRG